MHVKSYWPFGLSVTLLSLVAHASATPPCGDPAPPNPLSLGAAIDFALCNASTTRISWAQARAQQAALDKAQAALRPDLSASLNVTGDRTDGKNSQQQRATVQLAYTLFDFGQRDARISQASELLSAAQAASDSAIANQWLNTATAYFQVGKVIAQIDAARTTEASAQANLAAANRQLAVGTASPLDVLQTKAALSQAVLDRTKAESQLAIAKGNLAVTMGISPTQLPTLLPISDTAPTMITAQLDQLLQQAIQQRPEVRQALNNLHAADAAIKAAHSSSKPSLSLGASVSTSRMASPVTHNDSGSLGLTLSIPFDLSGATAASIREVKAQQAARQAELDRTRLNAESDAWQAYHNLRSALDTAQAAEDVVTHARKVYDAALARYQAGVSSLLDVLTAQSARANAEQQHITARFDWYTARSALAYALGGKLPTDPINWTVSGTPTPP